MGHCQNNMRSLRNPHANQMQQIRSNDGRFAPLMISWCMTSVPNNGEESVVTREEHDNAEYLFVLFAYQLYSLHL